MGPADTNSDRIDSEATAWVALLDTGRLSALEQGRLDLWLAQDTRHLGAFVRAQAMWRAIGIEAAADSAAETIRPSMVNRRRLLFAGGGMAAALVGAAVIWPNTRMTTFTTGPGETRRLAFDDGVTLTLDARSRIHARIGQRLENVILDVGRTWFDLKAGTSRPVLVQAGAVRLKVQRASFSADRTDERIDLLVAGGSVDVWSAAGRGTAPTRLGEGTRSTLVNATFVDREVLTPDALARWEAWKTGGMVLNGETIAEAAAIMNRHNAIQIVVLADTLASQTLVGFFSLDDPISFADAVASGFNVRVRRQGQRILLE